MIKNVPGIYNGQGIYNIGGGGGSNYKVIGGRYYRTVIIGGVEWLAENLDFKFRNVAIGRPDTPACYRK